VPAFADADTFVFSWNTTLDQVGDQLNRDLSGAQLDAKDLKTQPLGDQLEAFGWTVSKGVAVGGIRDDTGEIGFSALFFDPDNDLATAAVTTYVLLHTTGDPTDFLNAYVAVVKSDDPAASQIVDVDRLQIYIRKTGADPANDPVIAITAIPQEAVADGGESYHDLALQALLLLV
jgi:hypothetical protein